MRFDITKRRVILALVILLIIFSSIFIHIISSNIIIDAGITQYLDLVDGKKVILEALFNIEKTDIANDIIAINGFQGINKQENSEAIFEKYKTIFFKKHNFSSFICEDTKKNRLYEAVIINGEIKSVADPVKSKPAHEDNVFVSHMYYVDPDSIEIKFFNEGSRSDSNNKHPYIKYIVPVLDSPSGKIIHKIVASIDLDKPMFVEKSLGVSSGAVAAILNSKFEYIQRYFTPKKGKMYTSISDVGSKMEKVYIDILHGLLLSDDGGSYARNKNDYVFAAKVNLNHSDIEDYWVFTVFVNKEILLRPVKMILTGFELFIGLIIVLILCGYIFLKRKEHELYEEYLSKKVTLQKEKEMKTEHIANTVHELRNPLSALNESINIIAEGIIGEVNERQKSFLGLAQKNVERLIDMLKDLLDIYKMDSGHMRYDFQLVNINGLVSNVCSIMHPLANAKNLEFSNTLDPNISKIEMDPGKITQVLSNLVDNAIKYTVKGNVSIKTKSFNTKIQVEVIDTGAGIMKKDIDTIFKRFKQSEDHEIKNKQGSGLGLAICKEIVVYHGGKIWVESVFGEGSSFIFILPRKKGDRLGVKDTY